MPVNHTPNNAEMRAINAVAEMDRQSAEDAARGQLPDPFDGCKTCKYTDNAHCNVCFALGLIPF